VFQKLFITSCSPTWKIVLYKSVEKIVIVNSFLLVWKLHLESSPSNLCLSTQRYIKCTSCNNKCLSLL